jgi:RND family efflux transporter MFP subunit
VALVARVTGFLEKRLFVEGAEVKRDDLLYQIERPPFQAQVDSAKANVEQLEAQHRNAQVSLQRAVELLRTPAGQQSSVDSALASERSLAAQIDGAKAQLETAAINLGYTNIYAPIDGKITATQVTEGVRTATVIPFNLPPIIGLSTSGGFEYELESLEGQEPADMNSVMQGCSQLPTVTHA